MGKIVEMPYASEWREISHLPQRALDRIDNALELFEILHGTKITRAQIFRQIRLNLIRDGVIKSLEGGTNEVLEHGAGQASLGDTEEDTETPVQDRDFALQVIQLVLDTAFRYGMLGHVTPPRKGGENTDRDGSDQPGGTHAATYDHSPDAEHNGGRTAGDDAPAAEEAQAPETEE